MKTIEANQTGLGASLEEAQSERIVITRGGRPIAILVGVEGLDDEQLALCGDADFWKLISSRREEPTVGRSELEAALEGRSSQ